MTESAQKYIKTDVSRDDYDDMGDIEHVLERPGMYIGSTDSDPRMELLLNYQESPMKFTEHKISLSRGVERLFLEILSNAGDNADRSRRCGVNPGKISITMDKHQVRIRNGGVSIPIEKHKNHSDKYIPDIIFGNLRSSSNYDKNVVRMGCGLNGLGAKLVNIFSKTFMVKIGNPKNKLEYTGVWQNSMSVGPETTVTKYTDSESYVEVSWLVDFEKFDMTEYTDEAFYLFARYAADFSLTCKLPVSFNGVEMNFCDIQDYAKLYWSSEECENSFFHYEWPILSYKEKDEIYEKTKADLQAKNPDAVISDKEIKDLYDRRVKASSEKLREKHPNGALPRGIKISTIQKQISEAAKPDHIPDVEMMIIDTPFNGKCISFVNGMMTIDGGAHLNEAFSNISSHITTFVNNALNTIKKSSKVGKGKEEIKIPEINTADVKRHISIILNCRLPDPKFVGQTKDKLSGPKPFIKVPTDTVKVVEKWNIIKRLHEDFEKKVNDLLKESNGGRSKHLSLESGEDANEAGRDKSKDCILYLVEGKSASGYPKKRIVMSEGGKDLGGWFPLRGKFMNVRNAHVLRVAANKEVKTIKEMLGLREGVDYTKEQNLITLRYGFVLICTDADSDGSHIACLLINYFDQYYPGLLQTGKIGILRTPVVRIMNKKNEIMHRFFTTNEYESWEKENCKDGEMPAGLQKPIYYKGLGKSDDFEIKDDLTTAPMVTVLYDEGAASSLQVAFDKKMAHTRKEWIAKWRDATHIEDIHFEGTGIYRKQQITKYINYELIEYTKDVLFRAIPSMDDGLKRCHRQALYSALHQFKYGRKNELMGVSRFANYAANLTNYHHGETSMCDTVTKMAQTFIGSNNLAIFKGKGEFGTRSELGEDAASPRYLSLSLPKYINLLYDEEAIECIPKRVIEGDEVEPIFIPAVIPVHLLNGAYGIATGYSTFIPNHNYFDLITWLKQRCTGTKKPMDGVMLTPWYRGFKGEITVVNLSDKEAKKLDQIDTGIEEEESEADDLKEKDDGKNKDELNFEEEKGFKQATKIQRGLSIRTRGLFKIAKSKEKSDLIVTELPIRYSILKFRRFLEQQRKDKIISDFKDNSTTEEPLFAIKGHQATDRTKDDSFINLLGLDKYFPLTNLTLIDTNGYPTKFKNTTEILEVYYTRMIDLYTKVKQKRLIDLKLKMEDLTFRIRFIKAVLEGKILINQRKKSEIEKDMTSQVPSIPVKYLGLVKLHELTQEEIEEAYKEIHKYSDMYKETEKKTPSGFWMEKLDALEAFLRKNEF